ncbi:MAG: hypothetical protein R2792_11570 [Saprospiraceae bacterium]
MRENAICTILSQLSASERNRLDKFFDSPYHIQHTDVKRLFEALRKQQTDGVSLPQMHLALDKADIASTRSGHIQNYLLRAIEQFLGLEHWKKSDFNWQLGAINQLRQLPFAAQSNRLMRQVRKRLETLPRRGAQYLQTNYQLHLEAYELSLQQGRARQFNLQEVSDSLDLSFICQKLRTGCMLLSHQNVRAHPYDSGLLVPILDFLDGHPFLEEPIIRAYYHGYYSQIEGIDNEPHFIELKNLLATQDQVFSTDELHDLYLIAINFCIRQINEGRQEFYNQIFELYQTGLQAGALMEGDRISRWTYNNITLIALYLKAFEWAWYFLNQYYEYLDEEHRDAAYNFNLAKYYYETGSLEKSMEHLLKMEYDDVLQNLVAKAMLCKIYYELNEVDILEYQLDNIDIYLRRKKVLGYHKNNYRAFIQSMRQLIQLPGKSQSAREKILQQIKEKPVLTEKAWFLKQLT